MLVTREPEPLFKKHILLMRSLNKILQQIVQIHSLIIRNLYLKIYSTYIILTKLLLKWIKNTQKHVANK